jgi:hypothetical protein
MKMLKNSISPMEGKTEGSPEIGQEKPWKVRKRLRQG